MHAYWRVIRERRLHSSDRSTHPTRNAVHGHRDDQLQEDCGRQDLNSLAVGSHIVAHVHAVHQPKDAAASADCGQWHMD